ncbi:glucose-6-phosphate/phosphate and phosphoenolpyruvate/phosphate antiporter [Myxozyma melibiosi]|uniref:Glucose-6-phosphate/phosphate and phosphoenolpyruvate/phosphate antiporter n=1 Tax=Myxozyma melibiosi TaxID=54550 RepID=A0ABR1F1S8_9ASCO
MTSSVCAASHYISSSYSYTDHRIFPTAYPIFLTTWHLVFSATATQTLARATNFYNDRPLEISRDVYWKRIVPVSIFYSLSLVLSNQAYVYLNISFIQMLKATAPVAVFIVSYALGVESFRVDVLVNIWIIVFGVFVASFGEINFSTRGVVLQMLAIFFEALRLVLMNKLLHSPTAKTEQEKTVYNPKQGKGQSMDPLVCLYYFAPVCAITNSVLFVLSEERTKLTTAALRELGLPILFVNALAAFLLNVSVVFLVGRTSSLVLSLCGILKDIGLVLVSSLIWRTTISKLQVVGYIIALIGMFGYKFGYSPLLLLAQSTDSQGYKAYYSRLSLRRRRNIGTACLLLSAVAVCLFYYSQSLRIAGGVVDGAFENVLEAASL